MEYAPGGDLYDYAITRQCNKRLSEDKARQIFQQIIIALDYCHRMVGSILWLQPRTYIDMLVACHWFSHFRWTCHMPWGELPVDCFCLASAYASQFLSYALNFGL
jgi:hypothetical protein